MRKLRTLALVLILCFALSAMSLTASAEETGSLCGKNVTWTLENGILTVSGEGPMYTYYSSSNWPWHSVRGSIKAVVVEDGVTTVGSYSFYNCDALTSITLAGSVTSIGDNAFCDCDALTEVTIPGTVASIGTQAFSDCDTLRQVTLQEGVATLGSQAFYGCDVLRTVTLPQGLTAIGDYAFSSCGLLTGVTLPEGLETIGSYAFDGCKMLKSITVPASVTSVGNYSFQNCDQLQSITVAGDNGNYYDVNGVLFSGSTLICCPAGFAGSVYTVPQGTTALAPCAFDDCVNLTAVTLPDSLTTLGEYAFHSCTGLTAMVIPDGVVAVPNYAFSGCTSLASVTLPQQLTSIGSYAFAHCEKLAAVQLPETLTTMGTYAFQSCDSLKSVVIPRNIVRLQYGVFQSCYDLATVTLPAGLLRVDESAFNGCHILTDVYYAGSREDRDSILFESGNSYLTNATWHYGDAAAPSGYTARLTASAAELALNNSVSLYVGVAHDTDTKYAAGEVVITYDPQKVEFVSNNSSLNGATVSAENGILKLTDYGKDKNFGTSVYTLRFRAISSGNAAFAMTSAAFVDQEGASASDLIPATITAANVNVNILGQTYSVTLPEDGTIMGLTTVEGGKDYAFTAVYPQHYDYSITVYMNGTKVDVISDGSGNYTVKNVLGNLQIKASRTPKSYEVSVAGNAASNVTISTAKATYGVDYSFAVTEADGCLYTVEVQMGDAAYTGYGIFDDIYTIPGKDITGNILITVNKSEVGEMATVKVVGNGAGLASGYSPTAALGAPYTLTVNPKTGVAYSVEATMDGEPVALQVNGDTYTIANVTGNIVFTITQSANTENVEVPAVPYLTVSGNNMWLVKYTGELAAGSIPAYNGEAMFWSDTYNCYCYLVISETFSQETANANISIISGTAEGLGLKLDVNGTGKVDAADAQLIYNMYNAVYSGFDNDVTMKKFLLADVNGDNKINVDDAVAIVNEILN